MADLKSRVEAQLKILNLGNERGKFALEIDLPMTAAEMEAFERGLDEDWFRLIDVGSIKAAPGRVMRIFKLTDIGWHRRAVLRGERPQ